MKKRTQFILTGLSFINIFTISVHAYLDPGIGSSILQGVLTGLLFISTAIGIFWRNIKKFFSKRQKKDNN